MLPDQENMQSKYGRGFFLGYKLPKTLRASLREPVGRLFTGNTHDVARDVKRYIRENNPKVTISIGDYCSMTLFEVDYFPDIVVYDGKTLRENEIVLNLDNYEERKVSNPPEWISKAAWKVIENIIKQIQTNTFNKCRVAVRIDGEEDLLVIPAIILLPLGSMVIYGQPPLNNDKGIVVVLVTPSIKKKVQNILNKFEVYEELDYGDNYHQGEI